MQQNQLLQQQMHLQLQQQIIQQQIHHLAEENPALTKELLASELEKLDSLWSSFVDLSLLIQRYKLLAMLLAGSLLDHVEVTAEGSRVHVHLTASLEQIQTVVSLFARTQAPAAPP